MTRPTPILHPDPKLVGETYRPFAARAEEHLRDARLGRNTQVGEHFQRTGHCSDHISMLVLWQNGDARMRPKFAEMDFAHKLGTFRLLVVQRIKLNQFKMKNATW